MFEKLPKITPLSDDAMHLNSDAPSPRPLRDAAVLIPLVKLEDQWHILFIRRASNEWDRHSGQVAFPGGRMENSDGSHEHTALRETHEEIGIHPDGVQLLGKIAPYVTISDYAVTPVVGILNWPTELTLQESEVARAFLMPLSWLQDTDNFTYRARLEMDPQSSRRHPIIVFNEFDGETLWGATARMTLNFLKALSDEKIVIPDSGF
ncbi:CoA pyrophosphatase [Granulosicoccus sp.]|nr:CoA pyrophosphatase [Granulosicoccus sp.]MDB4224123.1 CoA pyrophosphatase [Granulosicoccus sp.]